nr:uncharacterized protein LOC112009347 [Quercus suber]
MPHSPWDLPLLSDFDHYSNFHCFLQSVTPIVSTKLLPKARTLNGFGQSSERSSGNDMVGCFSLSDVWEFYVEKSFYGASVPILLNNGESVVQYYAPSLSAIQIYTTKPCESISVSVSNNNSSTRTSQHTTLLVDHHEGPSKIMDSLGHLYFQFNETLSPYDRLPLTTKINELAEAHPGLTTFNNMDLSPYSWIAVAWYPIYPIPMTRIVKELSACFLTYHPLSLPLQDLPSSVPKEDDDLRCTDSLGRKCEGETSGGKVSLSPFAMTTYKMYGELWMNPETPGGHKERIITYQNAAHSWLKQLGFKHNDFNFCISHS